MAQKSFLAAAVMSVALLIPSARAADPSFIWGLNGHPLASYHGVTLEEQIAYAKSLGAKSYRVDVQSAGQLPKLMELVDLAAIDGVEILPVLTPKIDLSTATVDDIYAFSKNLAYETAVLLRGKIKVWELGNELENFAIIQPCEMRDDGTQYPCDWGPAGGLYPLDYYGPRWEKVAAIMRGLDDGMKQAGGNYLTAMGTAGWGHIGAFQRMKQSGLAWDISVWHLYGEDPEWAFKVLAEYGKPIWITEFNHPKGSTESEAAQAAGLKTMMEMLQRLRKRYPIEAAHIYELMDETYWAPDFEAYMGLIQLDSDGKNSWRSGRPKAAFKIVQDFIRQDNLTGSQSQ
ncbi:glycosyl hydrolase [Phyllobacterium sp. YR531]|uniref:glycosyl hydrolase n=1 Tax=Phyllobacterium sp. YR531 TaxID=1144343 RepID=UPI00026F874F|nr:glycosyl hydrolase [Phyllobacterium sp. YR531]EJN02154.1 Glycosyl hydrolase catalytic core [Phyllobacterium sp. YR531]